MGKTRTELDSIPQTNQLTEGVCKWNMGVDNEDFHKDYFKEKIESVLPCKTTFDAVNSKTAIDIFHMTLNLHGENLKTEESWYWIEKHFLWKLQEGVLPEKKYFEFYNSLKNNDSFKKKLQRVIRWINYKVHWNTSDLRNISWRQDYILGTDKIFQAVDDMIRIARIEGWEDQIWKKVEKNNDWIPEGYFQYIRDVKSEEYPFMYRNLETGYYYDTNHNNPEPLEYEKIDKWRWFLLFENYLLSKSDYSVIAQFKSHNNDWNYQDLWNNFFTINNLLISYETNKVILKSNVEFEDNNFNYIWNNVFTFWWSIYEKVNDNYEELWDCMLDYNSLTLSNRTLVEWSVESYKKSEWSDWNVEIVSRINDIDNENSEVIYYSSTVEIINKKTQEIIWTNKNWDKIKNDFKWNVKKGYSNLFITRNWRTIEVNSGTWEEKEIDNWLNRKQKVSNVMSFKKTLPIYNDTMDFVEHWLTNFLKVTWLDKMKYNGSSGFEKKLRDWKWNYYLHQDFENALDKSIFWKNESESIQFIKEYLDYDNVINCFKRLKFIEELAIHRFENDILVFPDRKLGLNSLKEIFKNAPHYYEVLKKDYSNSWSKDNRITIWEYNVIENLKTWERRLIKNLDWKREDREFIELWKDSFYVSWEDLEWYISPDQNRFYFEENWEIKNVKTRMNDMNKSRWRYGFNIWKDGYIISGNRIVHDSYEKLLATKK